MNRTSAKVLSVLLIAAASLTFGGCAAILGGAAAGTTVAYMAGDSEAVVDDSPDEVIDAAAATLRDMGVTISERWSSELEGQVIGHMADDTEIDIRAKREGEATKLWVRVGVFGDEDRQQEIINDIRNRL